MPAQRGWMMGLSLMLGAVSSCSEDPFTASEERALAEARARWDASSLLDYRVEVRLGCFCQAALAVFTRIEVRNGQVVAADPLEPAPEAAGIPLAAWPTVPDVFATIEAAAGDDDHDAVDAEFDTDLGYPRRVSLSCKPNLLDCGALYELRNLVPLTGGP